MKLYGFDQNCSPDYIRKQLSWLLDKNQFTCQREKCVGSVGDERVKMEALANRGYNYRGRVRGSGQAKQWSSYT